MRYLPLLALFLSAAAPAAEPSAPVMRPIDPVTQRARCERPDARFIATVKPETGVRKLGEMPPAQPIYTVVRAIDGCPRPVAVRSR